MKYIMQKVVNSLVWSTRLWNTLLKNMLHGQAFFGHHNFSVRVTVEFPHLQHHPIFSILHLLITNPPENTFFPFQKASRWASQTLFPVLASTIRTFITKLTGSTAIWKLWLTCSSSAEQLGQDAQLHCWVSAVISTLTISFYCTNSVSWHSMMRNIGPCWWSGLRHRWMTITKTLVVPLTPFTAIILISMEVFFLQDQVLTKLKLYSLLGRRRVLSSN